MWPLRDERADARRRVQRVADDPLALDVGDEPVEDLVAARLVDDQPRPGRAVLAHVPEDRVGRVGDEVVEVADVGHDDLRRLAAELEHDPLEVRLGGVVQEVATDLGRAGERDRIDVRVPADGLADGRPPPVTTLRTPGGRPASVASSAMRSRLRAV